MILKYKDEHGNFTIILKIDKISFCNKSNTVTILFDDKKFEKTIPILFIISITN
jgi:hypothetical protein